MPWVRCEVKIAYYHLAREDALESIECDSTAYNKGNFVPKILFAARYDHHAYLMEKGGGEHKSFNDDAGLERRTKRNQGRIAG